MKLDSASDRPVYQQIADGLRQAIAAGVFVPGDPVPSIRAQAVKLKINPNTIKRAYEELQREGVLEVRAGLGMFVTQRGESSARTRTATAVRDLLRRAVRMGVAADLSRGDVDDAYAAAWQAVTRGQDTRASKEDRA